VLLRWLNELFMGILMIRKEIRVVNMIIGRRSRCIGIKYFSLYTFHHDRNGRSAILVSLPIMLISISLFVPFSSSRFSVLFACRSKRTVRMCFIVWASGHIPK
jgi:hypothetical protein